MTSRLDFIKQLAGTYPMDPGWDYRDLESRPRRYALVNSRRVHGDRCHWLVTFDRLSSVLQQADEDAALGWELTGVWDLDSGERLGWPLGVGPVSAQRGEA